MNAQRCGITWKRGEGSDLSYCKWTKGCTAPGPWLAWIDGAWRECVEPERASIQYELYVATPAAISEGRACKVECDDPPVQLFCRGHAQQFNRLKGRNSIKVVTEDGEEVVFDERANPLLLYCRRQIETAVDDAREMDPVTGLPADVAIEAKAWIEDVPDWHDKSDFLGTFEWCCHWLGLDVERARREALGKINASAAWQRGSKTLLLLKDRERMITRRREERTAQLAMF